MSKVYHVVTQRIPAGDTIVGKEVHARVLDCIKTVTTAVLAPLESKTVSAPAPALQLSGIDQLLGIGGTQSSALWPRAILLRADLET